MKYIVGEHDDVWVSRYLEYDWYVKVDKDATFMVGGFDYCATDLFVILGVTPNDPPLNNRTVVHSISFPTSI